MSLNKNEETGSKSSMWDGQAFRLFKHQSSGESEGLLTWEDERRLGEQVHHKLRRLTRRMLQQPLVLDSVSRELGRLRDGEIGPSRLVNVSKERGFPLNEIRKRLGPNLAVVDRHLETHRSEFFHAFDSRKGSRDERLDEWNAGRSNRRSRLRESSDAILELNPKPEVIARLFETVRAQHQLLQIIQPPSTSPAVESDEVELPSRRELITDLKDTPHGVGWYLSYCAHGRAPLDRTRREFIVPNLGLVGSIAKKFLGRGREFDDLVMDGVIGLMKAVDRFEPDRENKFSTYASWWIRESIQDGIQEHSLSRPARLPGHAQTILNRYDRLTKYYIADTGREPDLEEACVLLNADVFAEATEVIRRDRNDDTYNPSRDEILKWTKKHKKTVVKPTILSDILRLRPVSSDKPDSTVRSVPDDGEDLGEGRLETVEMVSRALEMLDPPDRTLLRRVLIDGETNKEIAVEMGVDREVIGKRVGLARLRFISICYSNGWFTDREYSQALDQLPRSVKDRAARILDSYGGAP